MTSIIKIFFFNTRWGELSLVSLYISVLSGVIIGLQFQPDTPLYSSTTLELLIPYGAYFRSLHFYSSQLFFLLSIVHLIAVFEHSASYKVGTWAKYISSLAVVVLLLFSGYVLRGDTTGSSAGMIAENILLTIPLIGEMLNSLLFSIEDHGMTRVYLNHVIGLDVLWLLFIWRHLKNYRATINSNILIISATLISCLALSAPLEIAKPGTFYISGPWFFVGLQELLRFMPVMLAGVVLPSLFILALSCLRRENRYFNQLLIFILIWLGSYSILTIIGLLRS